MVVSFLQRASGRAGRFSFQAGASRVHSSLITHHSPVPSGRDVEQEDAQDEEHDGAEAPPVQLALQASYLVALRVGDAVGPRQSVGLEPGVIRVGTSGRMLGHRSPSSLRQEPQQEGSEGLQRAPEERRLHRQSLDNLFAGEHVSLRRLTAARCEASESSPEASR